MQHPTPLPLLLSLQPVALLGPALPLPGVLAMALQQPALPLPGQLPMALLFTLPPLLAGHLLKVLLRGPNPL